MLGAAVLFVGAFSLTSGTPPFRTDQYWTAYIQTEKERLAAQTAGPRILLFGSSSTLFGLKASEIEKATGIATINMGTHGGNGVAYTLREARKISRPGDVAIILVDVSTWLLPQPISRHAVAVSYGLDNDFFRSSSLPDKLTILSHIELSDIVYAIQQRNQPLVKRTAGGYWPLLLDENGDMAFPPADETAKANRDTQAATMQNDFLGRLAGNRRRALKTRGLEYLLNRYVLGRIDDGEIAYASIAAAKATNAALEANGVHYYYAVPPFSVFTPNDRMTADLMEASNGRLLGKPRDSALPLELMHDTLFHTDSAGAMRATANLIAALCKEAVIAAHGGCAEQRKAATVAPDAGSGQPQ